jgi:hypothetical protein
MLEQIFCDKHTTLFRAFVSYKENEVLWKLSLSQYSQNFIFFVTYEWAKLIRAIHYTMLEHIFCDKHTTLFRAFVNYKENEALWKLPLSQYSQNFIFFITYEWAQ